jgi:hypothetical protein
MLIGDVDADRCPSPPFVGSEGTTESVFRQLGHRKQLRAHLLVCTIKKDCQAERVGGVHIPVLFCTYAGHGDFEQTVRAVVATDFHGNTTIASDGVTFFTEEESMQRMKAE